MSPRHVLAVLHDAGGTVPPMLALAEAVLRRGHRVTVLGQPSIGERATGLGCRFVAFGALPDYDRTTTLEQQIDVAVVALAGRSPGDDLLAVAAADEVDVVVVDCNLAGAAAAAETLDIPSVLLLHSMFRTFVDTWFADYWPLLAPIVNDTRRSYGLDECGSWPDVFSRHDRLFSVVPETFEAPTAPMPASLRHFGFLVPAADQGELPPGVLPDGDDPVALVGLSTTYQHQERLLGAIVEALAGLPVRALVTTGPGLDLGELRPTPNVVVRDYVAHQLLLPHTDIVITHAGLGTVAAALSNGVPLVCAPIGRDQALNAERVVALGAGRMVGSEPSVSAVAAGVTAVLAEPSYRTAARALAAASREAGGAAAAAAEIESLLPAP